MSTTETKTVGSFSLNARTGDLAGPAEYMNSAWYADFMEKVYAGRSSVFEMGIRQGSDTATALLVAIQTDYAAWKGQRQIAAMGRR